MPSPHTITVTYTPGVESSWQFSPMTLQMTQSGNITFQRASGTPQWTFQSVNLLPANWTRLAGGGGATYIVTDTGSPPMGNFQYTVTVLDNNNVPHTSPLSWIEQDGPPIIVNDVTEPAP